MSTHKSMHIPARMSMHIPIHMSIHMSTYMSARMSGRSNSSISQIGSDESDGPARHCFFFGHVADLHRVGLVG